MRGGRGRTEVGCKDRGRGRGRQERPARSSLELHEIPVYGAGRWPCWKVAVPGGGPSSHAGRGWAAHKHLLLPETLCGTDVLPSSGPEPSVGPRSSCLGDTAVTRAGPQACSERFLLFGSPAGRLLRFRELPLPLLLEEFGPCSRSRRCGTWKPGVAGLGLGSWSSCHSPAPSQV